MTPYQELETRFRRLGALWMLRVIKAWLTAEQYKHHILGNGPQA